MIVVVVAVVVVAVVVAVAVVVVVIATVVWGVVTVTVAEPMGDLCQDYNEDESQNFYQNLKIKFGKRKKNLLRLPRAAFDTRFGLCPLLEGPAGVLKSFLKMSRGTPAMVSWYLLLARKFCKFSESLALPLILTISGIRRIDGGMRRTSGNFCSRLPPQCNQKWKNSESDRQSSGLTLGAEF